MSVQASGKDLAGVTYRWYELDPETYDGSEIAGAEGTSYTVPNVTETCSFACMATDRFGNTKSVYYDITVENHLEAVDSGSGDSWNYPGVDYGKGVSLTVSVSADDLTGVTYQWYELDPETYDTTEIAGAQSATYSVQSVTGRCGFACEVTDRFGNSERVQYFITVKNHLKVADSETNGTWNNPAVDYGKGISFTVVVSADDMTGVTYQWYRSEPGEYGYNERKAIAGETGPTFTAASITERTEYCCVVTDRFGTAAEVDYNVSVRSGLNVWATGYSKNRTRIVLKGAKGAAPTLSVSAEAIESARPLSFSWFKYTYDKDEGGFWQDDGVIGTEATLAVPAVTGPVLYECRVSDKFGNTGTVEFELGVENHFTAEAENRSVRAKYQENAVLRVVASADEGPLTYQWYTVKERNFDDWTDYEIDKPIQGQTGASLTVKVTGVAKYVCRAGDPYETEDIWFDVEVDNELTAYAKGTRESDACIYVSAGSQAELAVEAGCRSGTLTYEWKHLENTGKEWDEFVPVAGANGKSVKSVPVNGVEQYYCTVTDQYGAQREVYFTVFVEDNFKVEPDGRYEKSMETYLPGMPVAEVEAEPFEVCRVYAAPGDTVTLKVKASSASGKAITYKWFYLPEFGEVAAADGRTLTLDNVQKSCYYEAHAENAYGESCAVFFQVIVGLDANKDKTVNAADAAVFLRGGQLGSALEVLRIRTNLPDWVDY